jgi:hypothetical protein
VLLAMMFLTIIGGSGGWLAAERQKQHHTAAAATESPLPAPSTPESPSPSPVPSASPAPARCPKHSETVSGISPLVELLYIRTDQSEAWICQDGKGALYYQGHLGQPGPSRP